MAQRNDLNDWLKAEVLPHLESLRGWLRARYPKLPDVDNIVQDCVVRVFKTRRDGPVVSPKALLFAVARNLAIDNVRRQKIVSLEPITETEFPSVFTSDHDTVETVIKQQELNLLRDAIQSLPDRCRQVVTLRTAYGMSQRDIASRLGISENTVEKHMSNGIRRCTEYLAQRDLP